MTHYRNLTRISHRFVTIHNQVPLPLGEGAAKRRVRVNGVHSYRPSPGLRPPSPRGRGTRPRHSCPRFRVEMRVRGIFLRPTQITPALHVSWPSSRSAYSLATWSSMSSSEKACSIQARALRLIAV